MTQNWHTVMEFQPSLVGCIIATIDDSFELIRKSKECVVNIPEAHLLDTVVKIGNCHGIQEEIDKFKMFGLTPLKASSVKAPLIKECYASFECKLHDDALVKDYNYFIFKIVKAHVAIRPKYPHTMHYRGQGVFMLSGENVSRKRLFKEANL